MTTTADFTHITTDWIALARRVGESLRTDMAARDHSGEISLAAYDLLRATGLSAALVPAEFGVAAASPTARWGRSSASWAATTPPPQWPSRCTLTWSPPGVAAQARHRCRTGVRRSGRGRDPGQHRRV
ncbi:hypothetical protein AB4305_09095 [Nocardia sp. 2YAB30]|uniref:hypothetical protein n=1 Tax=unclassified Nocardia TaxID=2637762 RepID=UPI003F9C3B25